MASTKIGAQHLAGIVGSNLVPVGPDPGKLWAPSRRNISRVGEAGTLRTLQNTRATSQGDDKAFAKWPNGFERELPDFTVERWAARVAAMSKAKGENKVVDPLLGQHFRQLWP